MSVMIVASRTPPTFGRLESEMRLRLPAVCVDELSDDCALVELLGFGGEPGVVGEGSRSAGCLAGSDVDKVDRDCPRLV